MKSIGKRNTRHTRILNTPTHTHTQCMQVHDVRVGYIPKFTGTLRCTREKSRATCVSNELRR